MEIDRRTFGIGLLAAGASGSGIPSSFAERPGLNHLYAILDSTTVDAIAGSSLLAHVASVSARSTVAADGRRWSGHYVHLRRQYLEFFAAGQDSSHGVRGEGSIGFALGVDRAGGLEQLQKRITSAGIKTDLSPIRRHLPTGDVPWFEALSVVTSEPAPPAGAPALVTWAMEYDAEYFSAADADAPAPLDAGDVISRRRYNASKYHGGLLSDLEGASVAVSRSAFDSALRPLLQGAGWDLNARGNDVLASGPDGTFSFTFVAPHEAGLRELRFRMRRPAARAQHEAIGKSLLFVGPGVRARWTFAARA